MLKDKQPAERIPQIASAIVLIVGITVLIGWQFDIPLLKSGFPDVLATMKANTAICFVLAGIVLGRLSKRAKKLRAGLHQAGQKHRRPFLIIVCSGLMLFISGLTLSQYIFHYTLGIDQLLFFDQINAATPYPGRMGINTATNFVLLALALLLSIQPQPQRVWAGQLLTITALMITLQALIGYTYDVESFYQFGTHTTSIALNTVLTFTTLCIGLLFLYPTEGLMGAFTTKLDGGLVARQLLPSAILIPFLLGWLIVQGQRAGIYSTEFSISLLVVLLIIVQTVLIWHSINALNQNDLQRRKIEAIRQDTEANLRQSEMRFRQLTENIEDVFWMIDPATSKYVYISPQYEQIWGRSCEDLLQNSRNWIEAIHPDDQKRIEKARLEQIQQGTYDEEYRIIHPNKGVRWIRDRAYLVYGGSTVQYITGIAEDITERKQIKSERDRFFELSLDLFCVVSLDGYFKRLNPNFVSSLGCCEELPDQPLLEFVHPEDRAATQTMLEHLASGKPVLHFENRLRCKNGSYLWLDWVCVPVVEDELFYAVAHDVTQRKQLEQQLRQDEAQFRRLFDSNIIGATFADLSGNITGANDAFLNMVGYTRAELLSGEIRWRDMTPPEYSLADKRAIAEITRRGVCTPYEKEFFHKDGSRVPVLLGIARLPDSQTSTICFVLDLSDRKRAEIALQQSEQRYRSLVAATSSLVWSTDAEGQFITRQLAWEEYTGQPFEQHVGWGWKNALHPDDQTYIMERWFAALSSRQLYQIDGRLWHASSGQYRYFEARAVPILNKDGSVREWVGTLTDIHDRKQAEKILQERNERLELLYEATSELLLTDQPIMLLDDLFKKLAVHIDLDCYLNFMVEQVDQKLILHLTAYAGIAEAEAQTIQHLDADQTLCGLAIQENHPVVLPQAQHSNNPRAEIIQSLGITAYVGFPLFARGRLLGGLSFGSRTRTYFTDEELDLLQATADQVAVALERMNLLTSLQQQTEQLIQVNQIKDEFMAVLSHELRTPLNPILGWARLLRSKEFDAATTARALEVIERNAKIQTQLIEDLLDVSRILRGKLSLNITPVNLAAIIKAALETMQLAAEAKNIRLQFTVSESDSDAIQVSGDANRLQQVVWNLLSNAVKFTPATGEVMVRLERVQEIEQVQKTDLDSSYADYPVEYAQITVTDTGKGIQPDFLPYVFDYFRQADGSTTRTFGGLGLGLAIVRHLVELHGGVIQAASAGEGQGASFTIKLPLLKQQVEQSNNFLQSVPTTESLQGINILVVDDEKDALEFATFLLQQARATVTAVMSAEAALETLKQNKPDILISDIGMPIQDGYMLLQQIRQLTPEQGGNIPAIALTAYARDDDAKRALSAGFQKHITKPVEPDRLVGAIVELVGQQIEI